MSGMSTLTGNKHNPRGHNLQGAKGHRGPPVAPTLTPAALIFGINTDVNPGQ